MQKIWTAEKIRKIQQIAIETDVSSLNVPISSDADDISDTELGDMIPDPSPGLEELAISADRREILLKVIDLVLNEKEKYVIIGRFGFEGDPMTLNEIAEKYDQTRERIRQIEARALRKIKTKLKLMNLNTDNF